MSKENEPKKAAKRDWNAPSENPEFLGATPGALARALLRPTQPPKPANKKD